MTIPTREQVIATEADAALLDAYEKAFAKRRAFDSHLFGLKAVFDAGRDQGLREAKEVCIEQGNEWDSDAVVIDKNYAHHCAAVIEQLRGK